MSLNNLLSEWVEAAGEANRAGILPASIEISNLEAIERLLSEDRCSNDLLGSDAVLCFEP